MQTEPENGAPAESAVGSFTELLALLVCETGAEPDARRARAVAAESILRDADSAGPWAERVRFAAASLELEARTVRVPLARLLSSVSAGRPAVLSRALDGAVFVVTERRVGRSWIEGLPGERARWIRDPELKALVGEAASPDAVVVQAAQPLSPPTKHQSEHGHHGPAPFARLLAWAASERGDLATVLTYAIFVGLAALATPIAVQTLVATVAFGTVVQPLIVISILLAAGLAFAGTLRALSSWVVEMLERRFFARVSAQLAEHLPRVSPDGLSEAGGPAIANRFFDVFLFQKASATLLAGALEVVLTAVVGMVVLAFYHPMLLAFDVVLVLIIIPLVWGPMRRGTSTSIAESVEKHAFAAHLQDIVSAPTRFKLGRAPEMARATTESHARGWLTARRAHFRVVFSQLVALLALEAIASAALLGIGGYLVIDHQLTLGQLVAAELIVTAVVAAVAKIGKHLTTYYDLVAAIDKVGHLIDLTPERASGMQPDAKDAFAVAVTGVSLEETAEPLTLLVAEGEKLVVASDSCDARADLVAHLVGLRTPRQGSVRISGTDIADLDLWALRKRIALVRPREVFAGTLLENVTVGDSSIAPSRAHEVLDAVGLGPLVEGLPDRARTPLSTTQGSRGPATLGTLELGITDTVRLSVARALAADVGLVLVDGALDDIPDGARKTLARALAESSATLIVLTGRGDVETVMRDASASVKVVRMAVEGGAS